MIESCWKQNKIHDLDLKATTISFTQKETKKKEQLPFGT